MFHYVSSVYAVREAAYPYAGVDQECRLASTSAVGAITLDPVPGFELIPGDDVAAIKAVLASNRSLAAYFWVADDLYSYDSGQWVLEEQGNAGKWVPGLALPTDAPPALHWICAGVYTPENCRNDSINHAVVRQFAGSRAGKPACHPGAPP